MDLKIWPWAYKLNPEGELLKPYKHWNARLLMKDKGNDVKWKLTIKDLQYKGAERERLKNSH